MGSFHFSPSPSDEGLAAMQHEQIGLSGDLAHDDIGSAMLMSMIMDDEPAPWSTTPTAAQTARDEPYDKAGLLHVVNQASTGTMMKRQKRDQPQAAQGYYPPTAGMQYTEQAVHEAAPSSPSSGCGPRRTTNKDHGINCSSQHQHHYYNQHPSTPGLGQGSCAQPQIQHHREVCSASTCTPLPSGPQDTGGISGSGGGTGGGGGGGGSVYYYATRNTRAAADSAEKLVPQEFSSSRDCDSSALSSTEATAGNESWQLQQFEHSLSHNLTSNQHCSRVPNIVVVAASTAANAPLALPPQPRNAPTAAIRLSTSPFAYPDETTGTTHSYYSPSRLASLGLTLPDDHPQLMSSDHQEMQTPPRSPNDHLQHHMQTNGLHQHPRKRSHSVMSGEQHPHDEMHPHRSPSMHSGIEGQSPHGDDFSPRTRTLKRNDPPVNQHGKYFCDIAPECEGQTFDRKCEWSKHMDKHDRPYTCPHPACAKLQGFTYSGGLLRHEREVHGKHGGPKAQLMCPYPNCKRHSGKGFTRKENLNEHVRRVHESRNQGSPSSISAIIPMKRDAAAATATDVLLNADNHNSVETPFSRISEALNSGTPDDNISPALKRRRPLSASDLNGSEDVDDLRQEVIRLRGENAEKDARLVHMEEKMEAADRRREEEMNAMRANQEEMRQQMQRMQAAAATQEQLGMV